MYIHPENIVLDKRKCEHMDAVEYRIQLKLGAAKTVTKREQDPAYFAKGGLKWVKAELIRQLSRFVYGDIADLIGKLGDTKMAVRALYGQLDEFRSPASHQELVNRAIRNIDEVIGELEKLKIQTEYPEDEKIVIP
jgi:hypothetical protein